MRTPSLRRRAVLWTVGVLAVLLAVVGVGVDVALGSVLRGEQEERLRSVAGLAPELTSLSDQQLANRLSIAGITACIVGSSGECSVVGVPQAPPVGGRPPRPAPAAPADRASADVTVTREGGRLIATETIRPGVTLRLTTDSNQIDDALARYRLIMAIAGIGAIALAAGLLPLVLGRALRPLSALTDAARQTAAGGRGRRLAPLDPHTDLGRAARQFDAMLEELEGAERRAAESADRLARFLSDASHELRTPLAGISAAGERLIREPLVEDDRDRVVVGLVREARRAARLVDDLLLVSRLGELVVTARPQPLRPLLEDAADRASGLRQAPDVEVRGSDATVAIDRERMDQVLANLIANASAAGARRVRLALTAGGGMAEVRVSDDGPGIPPEDRESVFERLVRLDPSRTGGGAGLGLPIARGLVAAHGGTLGCEEPAAGDLGGATFVLRLPLAASGTSSLSEPAGTPDRVTSTPEPSADAAACRWCGEPRLAAVLLPGHGDPEATICLACGRPQPVEQEQRATDGA